MTPTMPDLVEVIVEDDGWAPVSIDALSNRAAAAALAHLGLDPRGFSVSLLACSDTRIAALNGSFRNRPRPTNVLSWPSEDRAPVDAGARPTLPVPCPDDPVELGDIAIALQTCAREAAAADKALADHATHLVTHAVLHLLGFDHERSEDADLMERLETEILSQLGLECPYV